MALLLLPFRCLDFFFFEWVSGGSHPLRKEICEVSFLGLG